MAKLYADEQFPRPVVEALRKLGHDVLTVQESGKAGRSDPEVLEFAIAQERAMLTQNRRDFKRLHRLRPDHTGIILCTDDRDGARLADRIHQTIVTEATLAGKLVRVVRPAL
jgi:predicted nuclease of predicted toxin-antitoxin system